MRVLITVLVVLSGVAEGVALPVAIRDGAAVRRAFDAFRHRPGGPAGSIPSVFKTRESFLVDADVRELANVVNEMLPKRRPWLGWLALSGAVAGTAAGVIAVGLRPTCSSAGCAVAMRLDP